MYFFSVGSDYLQDSGAVKFPVSTPVVAGTFPAAALQYRRGDVKQAEEVAHEVLPPEDLFALKGSALWNAAALDAFRAAQVPAGTRVTGTIAQLDPLACYTGRVARAFTGKPEQSWQRPLTDLISREKKTIRSGKRKDIIVIPGDVIDVPRSAW